MKIRISSIHEGKESFECSKCEANFSEKGELRNHISAVHEGKTLLNGIYIHHKEKPLKVQ